MKIIIIEDESQSIEALKAILEKYCPDVEVVGEASNCKEGILAIAEHKQYQEQVLKLLTDLHKSSTDQRIALPMLGKILFVRPSQIVRAEAHKNYTHVWLESGAKLVMSMALYEFWPLLLNHGFIKTHQSHIVNRLFVIALERKDNVNELRIKDGTLVPVARLRVEQVKVELAHPDQYSFTRVS